MTSRKRLVAAIVFLMLVGGVPRAHAQNLDDAIDAELDSVDSGGASPSTTPSASAAPSASSKSGGGLDDVQLDDGGSAQPVQTAKGPQAPAEKPKTVAPQAEAPSTETLAPSDSGGGPSPGVVQDELTSDEMNLDSPEAKPSAEPSSKTAEAPKTEEPAASGVDDINLDSPDQAPLEMPAQNKTPDAPLDTPLDTPDSQPQMPAENTEPQIQPDVPVDDGLPQPKTPGVPNAPQIATTADSIVVDNGNAAYEKKLSKISKGYRSVPDVNWDEVVGDRREENYKLSSGDTLWDISETFFGDGFYWAKLWSQNGVIGNPHHVMRGKGIKFVAGTESDAPAIGVVDVSKTGGEFTSVNPLEQESERPTYREQVQSEVTPEEIESGVVLETDELIPAPDLPPPRKRVAILKTLPKSFAESHVELEADYDATGLQNKPVIRARVAPSIFVNSYVLDGSPDDIGRVDEIESQEKVASNGQYVFVNMKKEMPMGSRISFVHRRPSPSGAAGPVMDVLGVGVIDGVVKENSNVYRAMVTTTIAPIEKGAMILGEAPPRITVSREGRRSDAHVRVVGGEFDEDRKNLGTPAIIYLNGGSNMGLAKGDIIGISAKRGTRRDDTKFPLYSHPIAVVKVADVHQKVATAIVLTSIQPIMVGDITSGEMPEDLPTLHNETADEAASGFGQKDESTVK